MARWQAPQPQEWTTTGQPLISLEDLKEGVDLRTIIHLERESTHGGPEPYKSGCCPFHQDRNPSFLVFRTHYCCMSSNCGVWGSIIDWYMHVYPGVGFKEIIRRIAEEIDLDQPPPSRIVDRKVTAPPPPPEPMEHDELAEYAMPKGSREWTYIRDHYHIPDDIIARERLGYDNSRRAHVIPVWDMNSKLLTLRFRRDDPRHEMVEVGPLWRRVRTHKTPKYWGIVDRNQPLLYNSRSINNGGDLPRICIVTFGEYKALLAEALLRQVRVPGGQTLAIPVASVSPTNGAGAFLPHFVESLAGIPNKYVIPDVNEEQKARHVAEMIGGKVVLLPLSVRDHNADLTDWVTSGGTGYQLLELITKSAVDPDQIFWGYKKPIPGMIKWRR